jgi:hypothetical protein
MRPRKAADRGIIMTGQHGHEPIHTSSTPYRRRTATPPSSPFNPFSLAIADRRSPRVLRAPDGPSISCFCGHGDQGSYPLITPPWPATTDSKKIYVEYGIAATGCTRTDLLK